MSWLSMISWLRNKPAAHTCMCKPAPTAILTDEGLEQLIKDNNDASHIFVQDAAKSILRAMQINAAKGTLCKKVYAVRERTFTIGSDGVETYTFKKEQEWSKDEATLIGQQLGQYLPAAKLHLGCAGNRCDIRFDPCA